MLVRFDPLTRQTREVHLPLRTHPAGLLLDSRGSIWYAAAGLGLVGRLDPGAASAKEFAIPSLATATSAIPSPWALAEEPRSGQVWFTVTSDGLVGRLNLAAEPMRRGFVVQEIKLGPVIGRPEGITADGLGNIWVAEAGADALARIRPSDGVISRLPLPSGSRPRGIASGGAGALWVTLFGTHQLLRVDPTTRAMRAWAMPSGTHSSPWAVVVDHQDRVWVAEFVGNTVVRLDPRTGRFSTVVLPTPHSGVRALAVDRTGRVWFAGSESGRLGMIE